MDQLEEAAGGVGWAEGDMSMSLHVMTAQVKDRLIVAERMRAHVQAADSTPLLIFPEGTCGARSVAPSRL